MKILIILCLVGAAFASHEVCGKNQHYEECGTACPVTCDNYQNPPQVCVFMCNPGCHCDKGYVKTKDGSCVKPELCPAEEEICGENQHYEDCGTACPITCENHRNPPQVCVLMCNPGCHCDKDYVKTKDGRCIKPEMCPAEEETCGENEQFNECGTNCPETCENYGTPQVCNYMCRVGCECKEGFIRNPEGRCVKPEECPAQNSKNEADDVCSLEADTGPCRAYFPKYFFNKKTGNCEEFIYGGCLGNSNNFETEEKCLERCGKDNIIFRTRKDVTVCSLSADPGKCFGYMPRFYFNRETGKCESFIYGGCGGNANNFDSLELCEALCVCGENQHYELCGSACPLTCENYNDPPLLCVLMCKSGCQCDENYVRTNDNRCVKPSECNLNKKAPPKNEVCSLPAESGPCMAFIPRFFYNTETEKCESFTYGGCRGNANNFNTLELCQSVCGAS